MESYSDVFVDLGIDEQDFKKRLRDFIEISRDFVFQARAEIEKYEQALLHLRMAAIALGNQNEEDLKRAEHTKDAKVGDGETGAAIWKEFKNLRYEAFQSIKKAALISKMGKAGSEFFLNQIAFLEKVADKSKRGEKGLTAFFIRMELDASNISPIDKQGARLFWALGFDTVHPGHGRKGLDAVNRFKRLAYSKEYSETVNQMIAGEWDNMVT